MMAELVKRITGIWRIVETAVRDTQHLDLCGAAFIEINAQGQGEMAFGALVASIDCGVTVMSERRPAIKDDIWLCGGIWCGHISGNPGAVHIDKSRGYKIPTAIARAPYGAHCCC